MGRHPTGKVPSQPLGIIMSKHREIMRRLIAGETQHRISVEMGITESRLSIICNSPLFKRELAALEAEVKGRYITNTADIQDKINRLQPRAVEVLDHILNKSEVDGKMVSLPLKRDVALDILELAGSGKKKNGTVADAMGDVVKIIADGFKLAKELKDASVAEAKEELINAQRQKPVNGNGVNGVNGTHHNISSGGSNISYPTDSSSNISVDSSTSLVQGQDSVTLSPDESHSVSENIAPTIVNMEDTEYTITDAL